MNTSHSELLLQKKLFQIMNLVHGVGSFCLWSFCQALYLFATYLIFLPSKYGLEFFGFFCHLETYYPLSCRYPKWHWKTIWQIFSASPYWGCSWFPAKQRNPWIAIRLFSWIDPKPCLWSSDTQLVLNTNYTTQISPTIWSECGGWTSRLSWKNYYK